jgi:hypothetical protein
MMFESVAWFVGGCFYTFCVLALGAVFGSVVRKIDMNQRLASSRRACRRLQQQINELKKNQP